MKTEKIKKPRGTMDIMPPDIYLWQHIENVMRKICVRYGFSEIRTPAFEELSLFKRGVGNTTDVVQKEMYTLNDKDGTVFALRPEGTASTVRAILENGRLSDSLPLKYYYIINCFRYEKPQAGRSREFFQFGTEMFGAAGASADFTVISLADTLFKELGLNNISLHINSIGCPECRPKYRSILIEYLQQNEDKLCDTCKSRLKINPLRVLDCKNKACHEIALSAPKSIDHLCSECSEHMDSLKNQMDACGIEYTVDPFIVRGLDYYTKTVFEFIAEGIGAQSSVGGGGRYDGLMEQLGGPSTPGIGFAMGITRIILAMKQSGIEAPLPECPKLYVASMGKSAEVIANKITSELRADKIYAECDIMGRSLKAQMKYADKIGAEYVLIIGDNEIETGRAVLKNMQNSEQQEISLDSVADFFKTTLK